MIKREIESELLELSAQYPVVTVIGPRQSGKTTLVKKVFPNYSYCNLEHPETRHLADSDINAFFHLYKPPVIIDEIQNQPELLSIIQVMVDESGVNGQFILTGSHQLSLGQAISQSLAGRNALLTLLPFSISEIMSFQTDCEREPLIHTGFMPRIYDQNQDPVKTYRNYFQTYIQRDVRQMVNVKNIKLFEHFMRMLAGRIGQLLNLNSLSNDLGVSSTTLSQWLSILEASFIVYRLYPYYENLGKRLVKSPKIYFTDVGLASYLIGIENASQVNRDPLLGNLFENLVVMEAVKCRLNKGLDTNLYFYRDSNQNEVDLLFIRRGQIIPIEIKAAMTYNEKLLKGIKYFQKLYPEKGYLIYSGKMEFINENIEIINFIDTKKILA